MPFWFFFHFTHTIQNSSFLIFILYCHSNHQLFGKRWNVWVAATVCLQIKLIFSDNSTYQEQSHGFEIFIYSLPLSSCISIVICLSSSNAAFVVVFCSMFLMSSALVCVIHVWNATKDSGEQENYINPSLNPSIFRLKIPALMFVNPIMGLGPIIYGYICNSVLC